MVIAYTSIVYNLCVGYAGLLPLCSESYDLEVFSISSLNPLDSLQLRVDHEWPSLSIGENGGILRGHTITGQVLVVPLSNSG